MQTLTACPGTSHWQEGVPAVLLLKIYNPLRSLRIFYKSTHSLYLHQPSCKITQFGFIPGTIKKTFNLSLLKSVTRNNCKRVPWILQCLTLIEICSYARLLKIWYEAFNWAQGDVCNVTLHLFQVFWLVPRALELPRSLAQAAPPPNISGWINEWVDFVWSDFRQNKVSQNSQSHL